jgi:hypothetical protein
VEAAVAHVQAVDDRESKRRAALDDPPTHAAYVVACYAKSIAECLRSAARLLGPRAPRRQIARAAPRREATEAHWRVNMSGSQATLAWASVSARMCWWAAQNRSVALQPVSLEGSMAVNAVAGPLTAEIAPSSNVGYMLRLG